MAFLRVAGVPVDLLWVAALYLVPPALQSLILVTKVVFGMFHAESTVARFAARVARLAVSSLDGFSGGMLVWSSRALNAMESSPPFAHRNRVFGAVTAFLAVVRKKIQAPSRESWDSVANALILRSSSWSFAEIGLTSRVLASAVWFGMFAEWEVRSGCGSAR